MGQESIVSIAAYCGLDGLGFEPWWWQDFWLLSKLALEPTHPPAQWVLGHCPGGRVARVSAHIWGQG